MATGTNKSKGSRLTGQALKDFRHSVAVLKRKDIVSKRVDARKQIDTRYMRAKVRKFNDVIEGRAIAVKAPKSVREKYLESETLEVRGTHVIAPASSARDRGRIKKGMVQVVRPLKNGQEETVYLPFKMEALPQLIKRMIDEADSVDALKNGDEWFSFRIGENNSQVPFADAREMAEYLVKYYERFSHPIRGQRATRDLLTFQRFKSPGGQFERNPNESAKPKKPYPQGKDRHKFYSPTLERQRRARGAAKKRKQRANETPDERARRLASNRIRSAQWRQRQFEGE